MEFLNQVEVLPSLKREFLSLYKVNIKLIHLFTLTTETNIPKTIKTHRTIFIEAEDNVKVQVDFPIEEQDNLTCEWLTSEAINKLAQNNLLNLDPKHPIIALQTIDNSITLDYWLSCSGRSLSVLKEGTILKPFYGDNAYKIENQKISLDYFHNIKLIGAGGFSKVYLGN